MSALQQRTALQFNELDNCVLSFHSVFDDDAKLAKYYNLLQFLMIYMCSCNTMACHFRYLSSLFKVMMQATLKEVRYLENFPAYIWNNTTDNYNELLNELNQRNFNKPHGRPPSLASMIWYTLHLFYTSLQVNRLLLDKFPILYLPLLDKIQQGGVMH